MLKSDPLEDSKRKLARAEEHFVDLEREVTEFQRINPYEQVAEPHLDKADHIVHKVKLTQALPPSIADIAADLVHNLRSALDIAGYAVAVASGVKNPKNSGFPFAKSVAHMASSIGRAKDIPQQIQSLFCGFQPYLGGDDLLWSLNEMANADKHKMLIPIGTGIINRGVSVRGTGFFEMPTPHIWDRTKNEMVLITLGPEAEYKYQLDFHVFVAFNEIEVVDGKPVLGILSTLGRKVNSILLGIEAEARRIGIFT